MNTVPNQRNTKQREIILEELRTLKSHPTAAELYQIVRKRLPKISLGTVYRNLELLVDSGTIRKLHAGGKEARFDSETRQHHHICCVKCGRMDDLPNAPGNQSCESRVELNGWQIKEYRVAFLGVCPDCRSQQATAENQLAREFTVIRY